MTSTSRVRRCVVALLAVATIAGCSSSGSRNATPTSATSESTTESTTDSAGGSTASTPASTATTEAELPTMSGAEVLDAIGPSIAMIETPMATGTAILIEGGYLVTNAHVVDPFSEVSVVFAGEDPVKAPVAGVDLNADVAVIGPLNGERDALDIVTGADLPRGADLYLVGFPGDASDPEATIARGVLSRRRDLPDWGLHLIQSDATIGAGQSGGALVDDRGQVVGMSGYLLDDFALALDGADVARISEELKTASDPEWQPVPADDDVTLTAATYEVDFEGRQLYIPAGDDTFTLQLANPAGIAVVIADATGEPIALNQAALDAFAAQTADDPANPPTSIDPAEFSLPRPTAETSPGVWDFSVGSDEILIVTMSTIRATDPPVTSEVVTSRPHHVLPGVDGPTPFPLGETVEGVAAFNGAPDRFTVQLTEGEQISIQARSALGDIDVWIHDLANPEDLGEWAEDGGGGLFDLDVDTTFIAPRDGTFAIDVASVDGTSTRYRLTIPAG